MIYPELFRNTGSSLPDRRATPRQKYGTGWVLNLARKIDISSTPLLIFPGGGVEKCENLASVDFFAPVDFEALWFRNEATRRVNSKTRVGSDDDWSVSSPIWCMSLSFWEQELTKSPSLSLPRNESKYWWNINSTGSDWSTHMRVYSPSCSRPRVMGHPGTWSHRNATSVSISDTKSQSKKFIWVLRRAGCLTLSGRLTPLYPTIDILQHVIIIFNFFFGNLKFATTFRQLKIINCISAAPVHFMV